MTILVWGINYAPELTGIAPHNAALCNDLRRRGHEVEMVTTFPYYPTWRKSPQDSGQLYRTDVIDGVPVHRCWHYVPAEVSAGKRIVHEGTFLVTSLLRVLWLIVVQGRRPDVLMVVSPPLPIGAAGWLLGLVTQLIGRKIPFVFHVQDLQPDAALGLGMLRTGTLLRALYGFEALAYRAAARVSGISRGMLEAFARKGVPAQKQVYFPNSVLLPDLRNDLPVRGAFRSRHGIEEQDFLAVYSGNLGVKQGLRILIDAAAVIAARGGRAERQRSREPKPSRTPQSTIESRKPIRVVICGDGAERETLTRLVAQNELQEVLLLLPLQSQEQYEEMLVDADLCLITQQPGSGRAFFPSKLLTTLAFARPVLTVADPESELVRALEEGKFGVNVDSGKPEDVASKLIELSRENSALEDMAKCGRAYIDRFAAAKVFSNFERVLDEVCRAAR